MQGIELAQAYVEFTGDFKRVEKDMKSMLGTAESAFKDMQSGMNEVASAAEDLAASLKDVEKASEGLGSGAIAGLTKVTGSAGIASTTLGVLKKTVGLAWRAFSKFNSILVTIARTGLSILRRGISGAISMFQALISVINALVRRLTQVFTYLATLPVRVAVAVNRARKQIADYLDELTKKFVFLQLDIRHIMQLMQKYFAVLAATIGGATAATARFEDQFVVIRRVTEMTAREYDNLRHSLRETASEIGRSAGELAEMAAVAGRLGIEGVANLENFATVMGKLAQVTVLEGEQAATEFARLMLIMGVSEDQMEAMASTIVRLGNEFAAFEDEILGMSMKLAGAGRAIGLSVDEVLGLSTAMAAADIRVERGGSAMSRTMIEVAKAVSDGGEALHTFADLAGTTAEEFATVFSEDPIDAIFAFLEGLEEMEELPFQILEDLNLAQIRTRDVVLRLLGTVDQLSDSLETAGDEIERNEALSREYEVAMSTLVAQVGKLWENIQELARQLGDLYAPVLQEIVESTIEFVQALHAVDDEVYQAIAGFLLMTTVIVGTIAAILMTARAIFTFATAAVLIMRAVFFIGTFGVAAAVAFRIARNLFGLFDEEKGVIETMASLFERLSEGVWSFVDAFTETNLGSIVSDTFGQISDEFSTLWDDFDDMEGVEDLGVRIGETFEAVTGHMLDGIEDVSKVIEDETETLLGDALKPAFEIDLFPSPFDLQRAELIEGDLKPEDLVPFSPAIESPYDWRNIDIQLPEEKSVLDSWRGFFENIFEIAFKGIPNLIRTVLREHVFPSIGEFLFGEEEEIGLLGDWAKGIDSFTDTISDWADQVGEAELDWDEILPEQEGLRQFVRSVYNLGREVARFFWEGFNTFLESVGVEDWMLSLAEDMRGWAKMIRDIDPSDWRKDMQDAFGEKGALGELFTAALELYLSAFIKTFHIILPLAFELGREIAKGILSFFPDLEDLTTGDPLGIGDMSPGEFLKDFWDDLQESYRKWSPSMSSGGLVGLQSGGLLGGYGGGDTIPALLERGEAVVPKEAVKGGASGIAQWFKGQGVPGFQSGFLPGGITGVLESVEDFLDEDSPLIHAVGDIIGMIEGFEESIESVADAIYYVGDQLIKGIDVIFDGIIQLIGFILDWDDDMIEEAQKIGSSITGILRDLLHLWEEDEEDLESRYLRGLGRRGETPEPFDPTTLEEEVEEVLTPLERFKMTMSNITNLLKEEFYDEIEGMLPFNLDELGIAVSETINNLKEIDWDFLPGDTKGFFSQLRDDLVIFGEEIKSRASDFAGSMGSAGQTAMSLVGALNPLVPIIGALITESETWDRIMGIVSDIIGSLIDALGKLLEPLIPIFNVLATMLIPIFNMLGTILSAVLMPIFRALFPIIRGFGVVVTYVAEIIARAWNALIRVLDTITWRLADLSDYLIDTDELSDARQELIDATWSEMMAKDELTETTEELNQALRNVPAGFAVAFRRFQTAIGAQPDGGSGRRRSRRFAEGGIVRKAVHGIVGEAGPEAIIPLDRLESFIGGSGGGTHVHFHGNVYGMRDFERKVYEVTERAEKDSRMRKHGISTKSYRRR